MPNKYATGRKWGMHENESRENDEGTDQTDEGHLERSDGQFPASIAHSCRREDQPGPAPGVVS